MLCDVTRTDGRTPSLDQHLHTWSAKYIYLSLGEGWTSSCLPPVILWSCFEEVVQTFISAYHCSRAHHSCIEGMILVSYYRSIESMPSSLRLRTTVRQHDSTTARQHYARQILRIWWSVLYALNVLTGCTCVSPRRLLFLVVFRSSFSSTVLIYLIFNILICHDLI